MYRFTEEILTKFENLESIYFEAVTSNDEFSYALFAAGPHLSFKNKIKDITFASWAPEIVDDEWFENLNDFLNNFSGLEKLSLKGSKIGENFIFISSHLKRLKSIDLQMNGISPTIAQSLLDVIDPQVWEELDLGVNWIGSSGISLLK